MSVRPSRSILAALGVIVALGAAVLIFEFLRPRFASFPFRHADGAGALGSLGTPVAQGAATDPRDGGTSWTYGVALCARDPNDPATIESISPTASIGDYVVLGTGIRSFQRTTEDTPIISVRGYPPPVPDAVSGIAGYVVRTPCLAVDKQAPYTELLVSLGISGSRGGGWRGIDVTYAVRGERHVLHIDQDILICGPLTDDDCGGPPFTESASP